MIVSFLFILTMFNRYVCKYTIYMYNIYTIYSIVYKKKKEESKEERRNNRLSDYSILGFLGSGNRVILSHIAEWGLFHSCSFIVITMKRKNIAVIPEHIRNQHSNNNPHDEGVQNLE